MSAGVPQAVCSLAFLQIFIAFAVISLRIGPAIGIRCAVYVEIKMHLIDEGGSVTGASGYRHHLYRHVFPVDKTSVPRRLGEIKVLSHTLFLPMSPPVREVFD